MRELVTRRYISSRGRALHVVVRVAEDARIKLVTPLAVIAAALEPSAKPPAHVIHEPPPHALRCRHAHKLSACAARRNRVVQ